VTAEDAGKSPISRHNAVSTVAILGAGAWGTALAVSLGRSEHRVILCPRRAEHAASIRDRRENAAYLPGIALPGQVAVADRWDEAARAAEILVLAVPSPFARSCITPISAAILPNVTIVSVTKGIEGGSLKTMAAMLAETVAGPERIAVLSGPSFAAEVARGKPAALVAAAADEPVARAVQTLFASRAMRVYRSSDVLGVELAGAAKNVIAIAAGISDGLDLGLSARAALITRGLAELTRLASRAGARPETIYGLAGLGDLVLTCTGDLSRNRRLGMEIGSGRRPDPTALGPPGAPVAEGASNARSVRTLAARMGVEMPIVEAVCRVLYEAAPAQAMVEELLSRGLKAEF
jgi:glycerol-3-phosphate dehydrogenase (NAD(P)+)